MWPVSGQPDPLCAFEKYRDFPSTPDDCQEGTGFGAIRDRGCVSRIDFVRYALVEGLREADRIGVNPYKFDFIGSTDAHDGTMGDVDDHAVEGRTVVGSRSCPRSTTRSKRSSYSGSRVPNQRSHQRK